jgi:membrane fusion protein (multidrug efflux system)
MAKNGMAVTARVAAWPERDFIGKLIAVVPFVSANSRTFMAEARFDNPKAELRPGMYAAAKVMLEGMEKAVFVPSKAVFYDNTTDAYHLYCAEDGVARLYVVQRGDAAGDDVRILNGLVGGEKVILNNQADLYDGAPVEELQQ